MKSTDQLNADTLFAFEMALKGHKQFEWFDGRIWDSTGIVDSRRRPRIYHDLPSPEWTRHDGEDWKGDKDAEFEGVMWCDGSITEPTVTAGWYMEQARFTCRPDGRIYAYKLAKATVSIPEGFTKWHGGECPVAPETEIEIIQRGNLERFTGKAIIFRWSHCDSSCDIIAYRVIGKKVVPWTLQTIPSPLPELLHKESGEICTIAVAKKEGVLINARGYYSYEQILNHFTQRASGSVCGTEEV